MLDGAAYGMPPLHPDMDLRIWIDSFTDTYEQLRKQIERHQLSQIDPYAVENPTVVGQRRSSCRGAVHRSIQLIFLG